MLKVIRILVFKETSIWYNLHSSRSVIKKLLDGHANAEKQALLHSFGVLHSNVTLVNKQFIVFIHANDDISRIALFSKLNVQGSSLLFVCVSRLLNIIKVTIFSYS